MINFLKMYKKSLKAKFLIPVMFFFILAIIASAVISLYVADNVSQKDVRELADTKINKLSSKIDEQLLSWRNQLELLSAIDEIGKSSKMTADGRDKFAPEIFRGYIKPKLESDWAKSLNGFSVIARVTREGLYFASNGDDDNIASMPYFKEVQNSDFVVSQQETSVGTGERGIELLIPIYKNKEFDGALCASVSLDTLYDLFNDDTTNSFIVDKDTKYLTNFNKNKISEDEKLTNENNKNTPQHQLGLSMKNGVSNVEFFYQMEDGKKVKKLVAYAPIKVSGWSVAVINNFDDLSKDVKLFGTIFFANLIILIALILFIAIRLDRLTSNIKKISESTKDVADGDLSGTNIEFQSNDDISILANSFNRLRKKLKSIAKRVNELSVNLLYASNSINTSIKTTFDASKGINNAIEKIARDAADPAQKMSDVLLKIEKIYSSMEDISNQFINISIIVSQYSMQDSKKVNFKEIADAIKEESRNGIANSSVLKNIIYELGNLGKEIGDISKLIANNSEEISKSTQKQNNELSNMVSTSNKLSEIASELRTLVKFFKVSQQ